MKLYGKAWRRARYRHWETWLALGASGAAVGAGFYFSFKTPSYVFFLPLLAGLAISGLIHRRAERYVARQYNR